MSVLSGVQTDTTGFNVNSRPFKTTQTHAVLTWKKVPLPHNSQTQALKSASLMCSQRRSLENHYHTDRAGHSDMRHHQPALACSLGVRVGSVFAHRAAGSLIIAGRETSRQRICSPAFSNTNQSDRRRSERSAHFNCGCQISLCVTHFYV